jgi:O-antigen ligase
MTSLTGVLEAPSQGARSHSYVLLAIAAIVAFALLLPAKLLALAFALIVLLGIAFGLLLEVLRGRGAWIIVTWILIFPLGYYFLTFPKEHTLISLDRAFIALLLVTAAFSVRSSMCPVPDTMVQSALWWFFFLVFAAISTLESHKEFSSLVMWFEAFVCPALLFWYTVRCIDVRNYLRAIHVVTCLMSLYVAGIGVAEVLTQQDLLPLPSATILAAGDTNGPEGGVVDFLVRPNGPFATDNSFAMDGVVSFFFLYFLRRALHNQMPGWQGLLHRVGMVAALAQALMPLFRSVLVSLGIALLVDAMHLGGRRRTLRIAAVLGLGSFFLLLKFAAPSAFEERTDPVNFYDRIAQQRQTFAIFLDNPILGVGLGNFYEASQNSKYSASFMGLEAADSPHSNFGAILAETGLSGFIPFVVSQVLLVSAFRRLQRKNSAEAALASKTLVFIFLCYFINGLSLTIGYYSDLNLWYMLVLGIMYKYAITEPDAISRSSPVKIGS